MDPILACALQLATLIRDSVEAAAWRTAWGTLPNIETPPFDAQTTTVADAPATVQLRLARWSESGQARPLLFPLVAAKFGAESPAALHAQLADQPAVWAAYQQMVSCLALAGHVLTGLRRIAPGYPDTLLIYTLPDSPWAEVSDIAEVPYDRRGVLTTARQSDPRFSQLQRVVPSITAPVQHALSALHMAIRAGTLWQTLEQTRRQIDQDSRFSMELERARRQFVQDFQRRMPLGGTRATRRVLQDLEPRAYAQQAAQIQAYVQAFRNYEQQIERIYWLLSQIIMQQSITVLSSTDPAQIQQIHWRTEAGPVLTAIAAQHYHTLNIGGLVYLDLPETGRLLNGIYFVKQWTMRYHVADGIRIYFQAHRMWEGALGELQAATPATPPATPPVFIPGPDQPLPDLRTMRIGFGPSHAPEDSFALEDITISWHMSRSMYLP